MYTMVKGVAQSADFTSDIFQVGQLDYVQFYCEAISGGTIAFQGSTDNVVWNDLDATNLSLTATGFRSARLGNLYIRAEGTGTAAVTDVFISGPHVEFFADA